MDLFLLLLTGTFITAGIWVAILKTIAYLSGWNSLRKTYEAKDAPHEINYVGISGKVGSFNYSKILNVSLSEAGLSLSVGPMFRFGHPLILIPWSNIKNIQEKDKKVFCEVDGIRIGLSNKIHNIFRSYLSAYS